MVCSNCMATVYVGRIPKCDGRTIVVRVSREIGQGSEKWLW